MRARPAGETWWVPRGLSRVGRANEYGTDTKALTGEGPAASKLNQRATRARGGRGH